jgi:hypothetical protein
MIGEWQIGKMWEWAWCRYCLSICLVRLSTAKWSCNQNSQCPGKGLYKVPCEQELGANAVSVHHTAFWERAKWYPVGFGQVFQLILKLNTVRLTRLLPSHSARLQAVVYCSHFTSGLTNRCL